MASTKITPPIITEDLKETLRNKPSLETVYFTHDGKHHFRAFEHMKKTVTRLRDVPDKSKQGVILNRTKKDFIMGPDGVTPDPKYIVASKLTRDEVLSAKAQTIISLPGIVEAAPTKALALDALGITEDDLELMRAAKAKMKDASGKGGQKPAGKGGQKSAPKVGPDEPSGEVSEDNPGTEE